MLTTALAGVTALAALVAVPLVLRPTPGPDPAAPATVPAQRMYVYGFGGGGLEGIRRPTKLDDKDGGVGVRVPEGLVEITDSGPVLLNDNPDLDMMQDSVVGLPDGRVVVFGAWDRSDGATKPDGTAVMDMRYTLVVLDKDGQTTTKRDLGAANGTTRMPGVTGDAAYILRGERLVRHDLATGTEADVPAASRISQYLAQNWQLVAVGGGRAILEKGENLGTLAKVVNLDGSGADSAGIRVCGSNCDLIGLIRLSPDGRHIAHAYPTGAGKTRLVVSDLNTGREVVGRDFDGRVQFGGLGLMAWADDDTLRLGRVVAPEKDGAYDLKDVLSVETVKI
ncbi:hypothetical protein Pa4123_46160 [Phytohabitans aurantiacus]|uniref:Lipoprotein n=1 Tax=Phytohabitans aurantiacus TaxID=3016789 RepID=A0ABQ5QXS3_9ACTN|nr:hypothetical protein Pa4123_46160 [Phytohabitans aurantiacus]